MHVFKIWHERLFTLERKNAIPVTSRAAIEFLPITEENAAWVKELRGEEYVGQFLAQLRGGDFGYYAVLNGAPVGYGWAKHESADDFFFKVSKGTVYLCRFFVHEKARGQNIYPALISALIEKEKDTDRFYIAVERGNTSSERGLLKVGFTFLKEYGFVRILRKTLNKLSFKMGKRRNIG